MSELGYPTTLEDLNMRFDLLQKHGDYETLVAVKNNQVLGFAGVCKALAFEFSGIYVRILAFIVSSNQRKQGIGTKLLKACEEWAIMQGAETITLNSGNREERQMAHNFYVSNGYVGKSTGFSKKIN
ncbi:GNAT family N-acetyltransferase [Solibacillus sp. R5-41]|nr:GNAT family N-acetyltransferase [Solibacillus sp. R5-41]